MDLKIFKPFEILFLLRQAQLWKAGLVKKQLELSEGQKISYWDGSTGTPVLLIHGLAGSLLQDFGAAASWLAKRHRVICFDLPGFGLSYQYPFEQSIANHSDFLSTFLDRVGIDKVKIIGNSMGGWISLKYTHRNPQRVSKLILVASAGVYFNPPPMDLFTPDNEEEVVRFFSYLKMNPPKLPRWILKDWLRHSMERRASVKSMIQSMLSGQDLMDSFLSEVHTPTLILWGEKDRIIPVEAGRRMAGYLPNAEFKTYPNKGHLLFHEVFQDMMKRIDDWLE